MKYMRGFISCTISIVYYKKITVHHKSKIKQHTITYTIKVECAQSPKELRLWSHCHV